MCCRCNILILAAMLHWSCIKEMQSMMQCYAKDSPDVSIGLKGESDAMQNGGEYERGMERF
jgi:hypothetical protein